MAERTLLDAEQDGVRVKVVAIPSDDGITDYVIVATVQESGKRAESHFLGSSSHENLSAHRYALLPVPEKGLICLVQKDDPFVIRVMYRKEIGRLWPPDGDRETFERAAGPVLDDVRRWLADARYELDGLTSISVKPND